MFVGIYFVLIINNFVCRAGSTLSSGGLIPLLYECKNFFWEELRGIQNFSLEIFRNLFSFNSIFPCQRWFVLLQVGRKKDLQFSTITNLFNLMKALSLKLILKIDNFVQKENYEVVVVSFCSIFIALSSGS